MGRKVFGSIVLLVVVCLIGIANANSKPSKNGGLDLDFYRKTCPSFLSTVKRIVLKKVEADPTVQPKLLRLHYHDCFVRGCDASIMLELSPNGDNATEKNAGPNRSISGYEIIDEIKAELEVKCKGVVSCADIAAVAARDAVSAVPSVPLRKQRDLWPVFTGRRDGKVSILSEATRDLPSGGSNFTTLLKLFQSFNLSKIDLVALSGAHTIGVARCVVFQRRLNFTGQGDTDPSLSLAYADKLRETCKVFTVADLDSISPKKFDNGYYKALIKKEGLLTSYAALLNDQEAMRLVRLFARSSKAFGEAFKQSMINMGKIGVITGKNNKNGEIRTNCRHIN